MDKPKDSSNKTSSTPKVFGWVAGKPAYLQEHPDNQKKKEEN